MIQITTRATAGDERCTNPEAHDAHAQCAKHRTVHVCRALCMRMWTETTQFERNRYAAYIVAQRNAIVIPKFGIYK
ncbi:hypothetical protein PISMIDRAFT_671713 [Pisolithus microcarpus 441]|uniref:Uncharacterized protein n=1 Tax=Pisolithus microcarpus 441 TaxID=765257 RepID=A0A0C9YXB2_9AGAM|nr:hypothetical protein PISMIDRAFT_671713 [Pisolithus microcarpus 441]